MINNRSSSCSKRPLAKRAGQMGFTIVEVMMAASVMVLTLTSSITTMQRGFSSLDTARKITIAGQIMQSELEQMRLQPWSTVDAYPVDAAHPTTMTIDPSFTGNSFIANNFTLTRTVSVVRTGMKQVTLTIAWNSYDGHRLSRSYSSYYGQNGLYDYFYNSL